MVELNVRAKRLMRELQEIKACPVSNICLSPLGGDNLDEWHGNIRGDILCPHWANVVLHFKIIVPSSYPVNPPRVVLSSFFPHINVIRRRGEWEVCLDMLETPGQSFGPQLTIKYRYWSAAYTIRSILVQLKSFLLADGQPISNSEGGVERVLRECRDFRCPAEKCSHSESNICPVFPTDEEVENAPFSYPFIKITGEIGARRLSKCVEALMDYTDEESTVTLESEGAAQESTVATGSVASEDSAGDGSDCLPISSEEEWTIVQKKKAVKPYYSAQNTSERKMDIGALDSTNIYTIIESAEWARCDVCNVRRLREAFSTSAWKNIGKVVQVCCLHCRDVKKTNGSTMEEKRSVNKNFLRREKKRKQRLLETSSVSAESTETTLCTVKSSSAELFLKPPPSEVSKPAVAIRRAGQLTRLPRDVVIGCGCSSGMSNQDQASAVDGICSFLPLNDILSLAQTCKSMHQQLDNDWWLWRDLFRRRFGNNSALAPTGSHSGELKQAWKYAYLLQANCLADELQCYHTRVSSSDADVLLGVPIDYTINPKTGLLDYVTSTFDILSFTAYSTYGVRRTVWGEKFISFLPLYIDEHHFLRGLDRLFTVAVHLMTPKPTDSTFRRYPPSRGSHSDNWRSKPSPGSNHAELEDLWTPKSPPEMVMALLMKMMNTQVVLLCDNGITASESALTGYCQLHRLMLAVSAKFPQLRRQANRRLEAFIRDPRRRVKRYTPSLGDLLCMLTISDRYQWRHIAMLYLFESFDRAVLWSCSKDNSLINLPKGDISRLEKFKAAHIIGLRLCLFHAVFLNLLVNNGTTSGNRMKECAARYDLFLGRPALNTRRRWHAAVRAILDFKTWPEFFSIGSFPLIPSPQQLLDALENSVKSSLTKGYHSANTKFENVMKSGVSRILLKGNSYSVDPGIKRLKLCERWSYDGETIFLDASCLIYDFNGALVGLVDYNHLNWCSRDARVYRGCDVLTEGIPYSTASGALRNGVTHPVRHSGDVVGNGVGQHTIDVDLRKLPDFVCALVFTVSSWTTSLLEIRRPSAHLFDVDADTELCSYQFEDVDTGDNTAVMMCKLQRCNPLGRWRMKSIGHVGLGRADNYHHILEDVIGHQILKGEDVPKPEKNSIEAGRDPVV